MHICCCTHKRALASCNEVQENLKVKRKICGCGKNLNTYKIERLYILLCEHAFFLLLYHVNEVLLFYLSGHLERLDLTGNNWELQPSHVSILSEFRHNGLPILILPTLLALDVPYDDEP